MLTRIVGMKKSNFIVQVESATDGQEKKLQELDGEISKLQDEVSKHR